MPVIEACPTGRRPRPGIKIAEGTYKEVASNQQVIEAYLGKRRSRARLPS